MNNKYFISHHKCNIFNFKILKANLCSINILILLLSKNLEDSNDYHLDLTKIKEKLDQKQSYNLCTRDSERLKLKAYCDKKYFLLNSSIIWIIN